MMDYCIDETNFIKNYVSRMQDQIKLSSSAEELSKHFVEMNILSLDQRTRVSGEMNILSLDQKTRVSGEMKIVSLEGGMPQVSYTITIIVYGYRYSKKFDWTYQFSPKWGICLPSGIEFSQSVTNNDRDNPFAKLNVNVSVAECLKNENRNQIIDLIQSKTANASPALKKGLINNKKINLWVSAISIMCKNLISITGNKI